MGFHIHLVKFDTIVSDGAANGWNNIAGARRYETLIERFFANAELNTVFFHDHLFANAHQLHGVFGALLVEEAGATFHHIRTGQELKSGTQAVIRRRDGTSFREFTLFVHDFAFLFDQNGKPLNPPEVPGSHDDPGVMGINYRCEPMRERLKCHEDPAYLFSSLIHGDPSTPILETYPGDELMIHLLDGAHEEQHSFNLTGMSWKKEVTDPHSPTVASQTLGISEAFNLRITKNYAPGDYLYYFGGIDDAWLGLWGILRVYSRPQKCLLPLCKDINRLLPLPPCPSKHGLFGTLLIEPAQALWYRENSLSKALYEEQAVITAPGKETFRECVVVIQNGIRLLDKNGELIQTAAGEDGEPVDAEDTGEKGYNYRSERFANRLKRDSRISQIFSSRIHGDYLYRSGSMGWDVESGMWGIFRVLRQSLGCRCRNTCRRIWSRVCEKNENTRQ